MEFLEMEYKRIGICSAKLVYKFRISKVSFWCDDMIFQTEGQICKCILHKGFFQFDLYR